MIQDSFVSNGCGAAAAGVLSREVQKESRFGAISPLPHPASHATNTTHLSPTPALATKPDFSAEQPTYSIFQSLKRLSRHSSLQDEAHCCICDCCYSVSVRASDRITNPRLTHATRIRAGTLASASPIPAVPQDHDGPGGLKGANAQDGLITPLEKRVILNVGKMTGELADQSNPAILSILFDKPSKPVFL